MKAQAACEPVLNAPAEDDQPFRSGRDQVIMHPEKFVLNRLKKKECFLEHSLLPADWRARWDVDLLG